DPQTYQYRPPVRILLCPSEPRTDFTFNFDNIPTTCYAGVAVKDTQTNWPVKDGVLFNRSKVRLADIKDVTSSTLRIGERPPSPTLEWGWAETAIRSNFQGPGYQGGAFWDMDVICGTAQRWQGPSGPNFGYSGTTPGYNCPAVAVYGPPGPLQASNA